MPKFKVADKLYNTSGIFPSEMQANLYILKRQEEIIQMHREDAPGKSFRWTKVTAKGITEYVLLCNEEVVSGFLKKRWIK